MESKNKRKKMDILAVLITVAFIFFIVYGIYTKIFYSESALNAYLNKFGIWAPIIFVVFQAIQVVFPILPGGIGMLGGLVIFGPLMGFIYNYVGICIGSVLAFLIAKRYGMRIIESLFIPKLHGKYMKWTENKNFSVLFAVAIILPIAPDDFLCYLAGTTKMTLLKFTLIILLGKPFGIAAYSFGLNAVFQWLVQLLN